MAVIVEALVYLTLISSLLVPLLPAFRRESTVLPEALSWLGIASFGLASGLLLFQASSAGVVEFYGGLLAHDPFSSLMMIGSALAAILIMVSVGRDPYRWPSHPAFYSLLPLTLFGVFYLAGANDVIVVVASWLLVSIISYVLVGLPKDRDSVGASVRYVFVGIVATLFIALWAGAAVRGSLTPQDTGLAPLSLGGVSAVAIVSLVAALGFKTGLAPFHWWLPSVYGEADGRPIAAVAGVAKLGFIALLVKVVDRTLSSPPISDDVALILGILGALSMTYGNIAALTARDFQRLLAYSSIAQMGYILVGLTAFTYLKDKSPFLALLALAGIALQSIAYALAKAPLFSAVPVAGRSLDRELRGLLSGDRASSVSASLLLMSLLGIPPLIGFWGKVFVFIPIAAASIPLLVIAVVNSALSSAYYIRALRDMVAKEPAGGRARGLPPGYRESVVIGGALTALLGLLSPLIALLFF